MADRTETLLFLIDVQVNNARALRQLDSDLDAAFAARERRLEVLSAVAGAGQVPGPARGTALPGGETQIVGVRGPVHPGSRTNPVVTAGESGQAAGLGSLAAASSASGADQGAKPTVVPVAGAEAPGVQKQWLESAAQQVAQRVIAPDQQRVLDSIQAASRISGATNGAGPGFAAALSAARGNEGQGNGAAPVFLNAAAAARQLGVSRSAVYGLLGSGQLQGQKSGGQWQVPPDAVAAAIASGAMGGGGGGAGPPIPVRTGGGGGPNRDNRSILSRLGWGAGFAGAAGFGSALSFAGFDFTHLLTTGLGVAGSAAGAGIGGGLLGLGSLGKLAVGGGSDMAVMKSTIADVHTLYKANTQLTTAQQDLAAATSNYNQQVAKYGKNSQQAQVALGQQTAASNRAASAQQNLNSQMAQLGPAAGAELQFAKQVAALNTAWDNLTAPARLQALAIMGQALRTGFTFLPLVAQAADRNLGIINQDLRPLFAWLNGPQGIQIFTDLENAFAKQLPTAVHAFDQGLELLLRVIDLASQQTGGFVTHLDHLLTRLNSLDNAQLSAVISRYVADFRLWDTFIKLLVSDIYLLFHQDVGTGNSIIAALTGMLEKLHAYETSARGSAQIQSIFMVHKTEVLALLHILGGLISTFTSVYMAVAPALVQAMNNVVLPVIRTVADVLASIARTSPFAATLIGLGLIATKAGGVMATANAVKSLVGWMLGLKAVSGGLGVAGAAGSAGSAAAGAAGAAGVARGLPRLVEGGALAVGGGLEAAGAAGAGLAVVGAGGAIAAALPIVIPALLTVGTLALIADALGVFSSSHRTFTADPQPGRPLQVTGPPASSTYGRRSTPLAQSAPAFAPGDALAIKKVGDYSNYSATQLAALVAEIKKAGSVSVNGISQPRDQVLKLAEAALKVKNDWNRAFNSAWSDVNLFYRNTSRTLPALYDDFNSNMRRIASTMGLNSNEGRKLVAQNVTRMVAALTAGMLDGRISVQRGMAAINQALKAGTDDGAITWDKQWHAMFQSVTELYQQHKISTRTYLADLSGIEQHGYAGIRGVIKASLGQQQADLAAAEADGRITHGQYLKRLHEDQVAANKQQATDLEQFDSNLITAMVKAGTVSGKGVNAILGPLNQALKALGAKPLSLVGLSVANTVATVTSGVNSAVSGALGAIGAPHGAAGMKVHAPTYVVGEEAPAHPEYVLATNPAYRERNVKLWASAGRELGVPGFAQGGVPGGYAGHPTLNYAQLESLWQAGGPGGDPALMAAIAMAESSGIDQTNSIGAAGYWQIHGLPFPGDPLDPLTNSRMAHAKLSSQGLGAWVTYVTGAYKQFLKGGVPPSAALALAQISAPKVTGSGGLADIVSAGLGLTARDANAYLSKLAAASPGGGPLGGGVPFHHGKFTFPLPAGSWHAGSVDQGWDISAPAHTPEFAIAAGTITGHGIPGFGPWAPILSLDGGGSAYYGHAGPGGELPVGTHVSAGQVIGEVGSGIVGISTGPHLEIGFYPPGGMGAGQAMKTALGYAMGGIPGFRSGGRSGKHPLDAHLASLAHARKTRRHKRRAPVKLGRRHAGPSRGDFGGDVPGGPRVGTGGPFPFAVGDLGAINATLGQIIALDGASPGAGASGGDAQAQSDLIAYHSTLWGSSLYPPSVPGAADTFASWGDPASFIISTDQFGQPVAPYLSPNLAQVTGELGQMTGWQGALVTDLQGALGLSQGLEPSIRAAISRRVAEVKRIKDRVKANLAKAKALHAKIKAERAKKPPHPRPKTRAQRAANAAFEKTRAASIAGWQHQIKTLESENQQLAGAPDSVPSPPGGELGTIMGQLGSPVGGDNIATVTGGGSPATGLYDLLSVAEGWVTALGGANGDIANQALTLAEDRQGLLGLDPSGAALSDALKAAKLAGTPAAQSNPMTGSSAFTYQGQVFTAGLAEGGVMSLGSLFDSPTGPFSRLPAYGGSFYSGGTVPGQPGEPRTVIAHGGEIIGQPGAQGTSSLSAAVDRLCAALTTHQSSVERLTRATDQNTSATSNQTSGLGRAGYTPRNPYGPHLSSDDVVSIGVGS